MEIMQANQYGNLILSSSLLRCSAKAVLEKEVSNIICNAAMRVGRGPEFDASGDIVLSMTQLNLAARTHYRTQSVKLARTIVDLAGSEELQSVHVEAFDG